jgi:hypothetical protein
MTQALSWLNSFNGKEKTINVSVGNEAVYPFYARFSFFPRLTLLQRKLDSIGGSTQEADNPN